MYRFYWLEKKLSLLCKKYLRVQKCIRDYRLHDLKINNSFDSVTVRFQYYTQIHLYSYIKLHTYTNNT